jgi:hypothetical protein
MINLIPNEEKKKKVKDFYFRLAVTFFTVMGASILLAIVGILPSYFLSQVKKNFASTKLSNQSTEPASSPEAILSLQKDLDKKLKIVEKSEANNYVVSEKVIGQILIHKMSDIKISSISYQNDSKGKLISINGTAPSRERLLVFRKSIEDDKAFSKVDLPISNFVRGSNITFAMTIVPATK